MNTTARLARTALALTLVGAFTLTGCTAPEPSATSARPAADVVHMDDSWIKAADDGMSASFGTLVNDGETDITVVSAETDAADALELHETVENEAGEMIMREIEGGFVIPAGGRLTLEPGGDHIMLMGLTHPLIAGDEVSLTLTFSDDSSYAFTAPVKDYSGANENYDEGGEHEGMDH